MKRSSSYPGEVGERSTFMERNALRFLREWPKIDPALEGVIERFISAGLITKPLPDVDRYPWGCELTAPGEALKALVETQTFNLWMKQDIADILPDGDLSENTRLFLDDLPEARVGTVRETKPLGFLGAVIAYEIQIEALIDAMKDRK
jgi:hypothetical protein